MTKKYKIGLYIAEDTMGDLISENYSILHVLNRLGISLGFGEKSIAEVCSEYDIDQYTFLAIINLLTTDDKGSFKIDFDNISTSTLTKYLHNSHSYYLDYRLPKIRTELQNTIGSSDPIAIVIIDYFDKYVAEVKRHMMYEEEVVFPYIKEIIDNKQLNQYNIDIYGQHHDHIEEKLSELKNILIKYYHVETTFQFNNILLDIFSCETDLALHNNIEDYILIPAIKRVEHLKKDNLLCPKE